MEAYFWDFPDFERWKSDTLKRFLKRAPDCVYLFSQGFSFAEIQNKQNK